MEIISHENIVYMIFNVFCVLILIHILINFKGNAENRKANVYFRMSAVTMLIFVVFDLIWKLIYDKEVVFDGVLWYLSNSVYFISCGVSSFLWFLHSESICDSKYMTKKWFYVVSSIPLLVLVLMSITTHHTKLLFYMDKNGSYCRGMMFVVDFIVPYLYILIASARAFIKAVKLDNYANRRYYFTLANFAVFPIITMILQFFISDAPLSCLGGTFALLTVHGDMQKELVSLDALTGLNNRSQMIRYLTERLQHFNYKKMLFLIMIDVDKFKLINDRFGHVVGDAALVWVGRVLQEAAQIHGGFVARYGGDEFVMIYETEDEKSIDNLCNYIYDCFESANKESEKEHCINVSIGYAKYDSKYRYIPDFVAEADKNLYKIKEIKKEKIKTPLS